MPLGTEFQCYTEGELSRHNHTIRITHSVDPARLQRSGGHLQGSRSDRKSGHELVASPAIRCCVTETMHQLVHVDHIETREAHRKCETSGAALDCILAKHVPEQADRRGRITRRDHGAGHADRSVWVVTPFVAPHEVTRQMMTEIN